MGRCCATLPRFFPSRVVSRSICFVRSKRARTTSSSAPRCCCLCRCLGLLSAKLLRLLQLRCSPTATSFFHSQLTARRLCRKTQACLARLPWRPRRCLLSLVQRRSGQTRRRRAHQQSVHDACAHGASLSDRDRRAYGAPGSSSARVSRHRLRRRRQLGLRSSSSSGARIATDRNSSDTAATGSLVGASPTLFFAASAKFEH